MRYLIVFMLFLFPLSGISAQTATPTPTDLKFTQEISAFGLTVYYPNIMSAVIQDEINFYFEDDSADTFAITPPQTLDEFWGIPQSDLFTITDDFYDLLVGNHTDTEVLITITPMSINNYPANYFVLQNEGVYTLVVYVFDTPLGTFSARLETHETDYLPKTDLIMRILKAIDVSSGLPVGVIARTAPTPDVRMGERIASLDETVTYQMPFGWVRDSASDQADLIADSQATLDSLNNGFVVPSDNMALGMISPDLIGTLGVNISTPYAIITELQTILDFDAQAYPIWHYTNLPYTVYIQQLGTSLFENAYLVSMYIPDTDALMLLFVFTQDFDRDESILLAVMNSLQVATRR